MSFSKADLISSKVMYSILLKPAIRNSDIQYDRQFAGNCFQGSGLCASYAPLHSGTGTHPLSAEIYGLAPQRGAALRLSVCDASPHAMRTKLAIYSVRLSSKGAPVGRIGMIASCNKVKYRYIDLRTESSFMAVKKKSPNMGKCWRMKVLS